MPEINLSDDSIKKLASEITRGLFQEIEKSAGDPNPGTLGLILRDLVSEIQKKERLKAKELEREKRLSKIDQFLDIDPRSLDFEVFPKIDVRNLNMKKAFKRDANVGNVPIGV